MDFKKSLASLKDGNRVTDNGTAGRDDQEDEGEEVVVQLSEEALRS